MTKVDLLLYEAEQYEKEVEAENAAAAERKKAKKEKAAKKKDARALIRNFAIAAFMLAFPAICNLLHKLGVYETSAWTLFWALSLFGAVIMVWLMVLVIVARFVEPNDKSNTP